MAFHQVRSLLCLAPASSSRLPLQYAHVKRAAEALGYSLKAADEPRRPTDLPKLWCVTQPLPPFDSPLHVVSSATSTARCTAPCTAP